MTRRRVTIALGLALSVALLWWALRDASPSEIFSHLRSADFLLLAAAVLVATGTFVLRAMRWRVLLLPTLERSSFGSRFSAVCIGSMANNLLPARLGELARVYAFSRNEPIGMSATLGSLVLERLFDALVLTVLLLPALTLPGSAAGAVSPTMRDVFTASAILVTLGLVLLGLLVRFPNVVLRFVERVLGRVLPRRAADRVGGILVAFIAGLGALRHAHVFLRAMAWSFVVWLWNALSFYLGFLAFGIRAPGVEGALFLQSVIGFAVSVPSSPGFFGPFEAGARVALGVYGVDPSQIVSFAASYHIFSFFPVTVLGLWFAHRLGMTLTDVGHSDEYVEAAVEGSAEAGDAGD